MSAPTPARNAPAAAMAFVFWALLLTFVVLDWLRTPQRNRFDEPPPFAIGSGPAATAGFCAAPPSAPKR